ncbi:MAG: DUF6318 family protein, partial [Pedococcus sp.]
AAASKKTPEGAEAFARFYTEQLDNAAASGETAALKSLTMKSCSTCQDFIGVVDGRATRSEHGEKESFELGAVQLDPGSPEDRPVVDVLVKDVGGNIINGSGAVVSTSAPAKFNFRHTLKWVGNAWRVADSEIVQ